MDTPKLVRNNLSILTIGDWLSRAKDNKINFYSDTSTLHTALQQACLPCYLDSIEHKDECTFILMYLTHLRDKSLLVFSKTKSSLDNLCLVGELYKYDDSFVLSCSTSRENIEIIRKIFPHTAPSPPLSIQHYPDSSVSFGLGDRLGIASFGHLKLINHYQIIPVLAQQSKRELKLCNRTYSEIIDEASWDVFAFGFKLPWGADGDHLKNPEEVLEALEMGCSMITLDLSDKIRDNLLKCSDKDLVSHFNLLDKDIQDYYCKKYLEKKHSIDNTFVIEFSKTSLMRYVLTFHEAILLAINLHKLVKNYQASHNTKIDLEISIDECSVATSYHIHYYIARELTDHNVEFETLAPRFCGDFQKGIDYIGDLEQFNEELKYHAKIARVFNYKISIHSGSDKFSVFPHIGMQLGKYFHLKTSGTNWLVALKTISEIDPILFRSIHSKAYEVFDTAKSYYHITPNFSKREHLESLDDKDLIKLFNNDCDRQVLHIAYGEIFKDKILYEKIYYTLENNLELYWDNLNEHIRLHLDALQL